MRVEAYNQIAQIYKTKQVSATKSVSAVAKKDEFVMSQTGRDYQIAKQALADAPEIRKDKVAKLKSQIESGEYHVDAGDFAGKLLEKYNSLQ
ncbi:MAG: flagellar biosynthesis anti-sigma factor FlgM [Lachnospiraceae bacterium]